jgi:hypothetical protein
MSGFAAQTTHVALAVERAERVAQPGELPPVHGSRAPHGGEFRREEADITRPHWGRVAVF